MNNSAIRLTSDKMCIRDNGIINTRNYLTLGWGGIEIRTCLMIILYSLIAVGRIKLYEVSDTNLVHGIRVRERRQRLCIYLLRVVFIQNTTFAIHMITHRAVFDPIGKRDLLIHGHGRSFRIIR